MPAHDWSCPQKPPILCMCNPPLFVRRVISIKIFTKYPSLKSLMRDGVKTELIKRSCTLFILNFWCTFETMTIVPPRDQEINCRTFLSALDARSPPSLMDFPAQKMPAGLILHLLSFFLPLQWENIYHNIHFLDCYLFSRFRKLETNQGCAECRFYWIFKLWHSEVVQIQKWPDFPSLWHGLNSPIFRHSELFKIKENSLCYGLNCPRW